jgi:hypothetical protein
MAKLSILGAQRVKALQELLINKQAEAITALEIPSYAEVQDIVDKEFGVDDWQNELQTLIKQAQKLADKINAATGKDVSISRNERTYGSNPYSKRVNELTKQLRDKKINEVKAEYKQKANMLWLCETLEEAKQIVGI